MYQFDASLSTFNELALFVDGKNIFAIVKSWIFVVLHQSFNLDKKVMRFDPLSKETSTKAKLQKKVFLFLIHLFARDILLMKKQEIEETKTTQYSTLKTDTIKVGLLFSISNFFTKKSPLANKWMSFSYSNSALKKRKKKIGTILVLMFLGTLCH